MIRAKLSRADDRKGYTLLLGITDDNIRELRKDNPIRVDMSEFDPEALEGVTLYIVTGKDEGDITRKLYGAGVLPDPVVTTMMPGKPMQPGEERKFTR